jgi:type IV secretion system protein TrbF
MNAVAKLKSYFQRFGLKQIVFETESSVPETPYLNARRTWNEHVGSLVSAKQTWQFVGIVSLLIALASIGGMIHIGSQSKYIPYVIEVDKLGRIQAAGPARSSSREDPRILRAAISNFITNARMVTFDISLQRKAVHHVYAYLGPKDPATQKINEWYKDGETNAFERATRELVSTDVVSILQQSPDTWQIEWTETVRDRTGTAKGPPLKMRALVTIYTAESTPETTAQQMQDNPFGVFVRDFSWTQIF